MFGTSCLTDAIGLLKDDHRAVEALLDRFEASNDESQRRELADDVCRLLRLHTQIEEQLFYPALREAGMPSELLDQAQVEHEALRRLIDQIDGAARAAERFDARVHVLGEYLRHHIEEEEREIMPKARSLGIDLDLLGEQILALRARAEERIRRHGRSIGRGDQPEVRESSHELRHP